MTVEQSPDGPTRPQQTIASSTRLSGPGLHTGAECTLTISPLPEESGVQILLPGLKSPFPATIEYQQDLLRCTALGVDGLRVLTVEHVLSALAGCEIDNCLLTIEGGETPALDGSAAPLVAAILEMGIVEQAAQQKVVRIERPIWVEDAESHIMALPSNELRVTCGIDFDHPVLGQQIYSEVLTGPVYRRDISPARTFGFLHEVEALRASGRALGGTQENAVVIGDHGYLSRLRFPDECVRHKVLDLVGDLALLGRPLRAHLVAFRTSHRLNARLVRKILDAQASDLGTTSSEHETLSSEHETLSSAMRRN